MLALTGGLPESCVPQIINDLPDIFASVKLNDVVAVPLYTYVPVIRAVLLIAPMFAGVAHCNMPSFNLAGVISRAVVLVPACISACVIAEYVVLRNPTICQYKPSYISATIPPAFHELAVLVPAAVAPYRFIAFAPVPLTFRVGFVAVL